MKRLLSLLLLAGCAAGVQAEDSAHNIIVERYTDFVAVDRLDATRNLNVVLAGPEGYRKEMRQTADEAAFIETRDVDGTTLPDGLYHFEAWTEPQKLVTRSPDDPRAGRDAGLERTARVFSDTVSGSFRVVDGVIVDPSLEEAPARPVGQVQP